MEQLMRVQDLTRTFAAASSSLFREKRFTAVDHVSFEIFRGETLGLLGESGCGKSTIAKLLLGLIEPTEGRIFYCGRDVTGRIDPLRQEIQMIFQNPFASFDPRMRIGDMLMEPLDQWHIGADRRERQERVRRICAECGLEEDTPGKYPPEFSGGQLQRISIARALLTEPRLLVADEIVSALDVSVQAQILALLERMKERHGLTVLFISHDLSVIRRLCDRVMVMRHGRLVECGSCAEVMDRPKNEYVAELKRAAFPLYGPLRQE